MGGHVPPPTSGSWEMEMKCQGLGSDNPYGYGTLPLQYTISFFSSLPTTHVFHIFTFCSPLYAQTDLTFSLHLNPDTSSSRKTCRTPARRSSRPSQARRLTTARPTPIMPLRATVLELGGRRATLGCPRHEVYSARSGGGLLVVLYLYTHPADVLFIIEIEEGR
jgi:hypothetical protein